MDVNKILESLQSEMKSLRSDYESEKINRQELEAKLSKVESALPSLASTIDEIGRRNSVAESKPWTAGKMDKSNGYKEGSIRKEELDGTPRQKLPFTGKESACPWCNERALPNLLDLTKSGRWACRSCGKHWYTEALNQPYSLELEKFIREDGSDDPIKRSKMDAKAQKATDEIDDLKRQLSEMKDIMLRRELKNGKV